VALPSVEFHPDAVAEARAAFLWYSERSPSAADAFRAALDHAISAIRDNPQRWPRHVHGTRKYRLRRFPYGVICRVTDAAIEVVAVVHGRRRPGYWKTRRF
jgi:plasmid stabilization system protein ParE